MVDQTSASWNRLTYWLRLVSTLAAGAQPEGPEGYHIV
jgi:hypothetical protein